VWCSRAVALGEPFRARFLIRRARRSGTAGPFWVLIALDRPAKPTPRDRSAGNKLDRVVNMSSSSSTKHKDEPRSSGSGRDRASQRSSSDQEKGGGSHVPSLKSLKGMMSTQNLAAKMSRNRLRTSSIIRPGGLAKAKSVDLGDGVELTEEMIAEFKECFTLFDKSGDGSVSIDEVGEVMRQLGADLTREKLQRLISEVDKDGSGELEFPEFIQLMARQMREGTDDKPIKDMFLMLSNGEKLVSVVAVRSMLYKLIVQNPDEDHKVSAVELQGMMEDALGMHAPDDDEVMTYSQFKRMLDSSVVSGSVI